MECGTLETIPSPARTPLGLEFTYHSHRASRAHAQHPPPPAASWQRLAGGGPGPLPLQPSGDCPDPQAPLPRDNPTRQRETPAGAPYAERTPKGGPKPGFELRAAQPCRQPLGPPGSGSTGPGLQGQKGRATTVRGPLRPRGLGKGPLSAPEPDPRALSQAAVCPPLK